MQNETSQIRRVLMKHAEQAFVSQEKISSEWRGLNYLAEPDFMKACAQSDALADILSGLGCSVEWLAADDTVGIDSIYVRDNAIASDKGLVLCRGGAASGTFGHGARAGAGWHPHPWPNRRHRQNRGR